MSQRRMPSGQRPTSAGRRSVGVGRGESRTGGTVQGGGKGARQPVRQASRQTERRKPPAARRGPGTSARSAGVKRTRAPQPRRLTGRATILLIVLVSLALGYTYPIRVYLAQQSEINSTRAALRDQQARIAGLREEAAKWQDDEYVRIQARSRLYYARPGELLLIPWWDADGAARDAGRTAPKPPEPPEPWFDTLWTSVQAANR